MINVWHHAIEPTNANKTYTTIVILQVELGPLPALTDEGPDCHDRVSSMSSTNLQTQTTIFQDKPMALGDDLFMCFYISLLLHIHLYTSAVHNVD